MKAPSRTLAPDVRSRYDRVAMKLVAAPEEYLRQNTDILAVYLFGSRAEGVERTQSDTDVAVLLMPHIAKQQYASYLLQFL